jgi:(S)-2-hydroxyglutarate dehydrogenase
MYIPTDENTDLIARWFDMMKYDYVIVGGGIVGVSTAWQLQRRHPDKKILLIEKESALAQHQTGHNSGVIHAGVYYEPGSLKARFCKEGLEATITFCREHNIAFEQCGKLLVATNAIEFERMQTLFARCQKNNIDVQWLDEEQLKQREPNITGLGAIWVKETGIVDYQSVCLKMAECFRKLGGQVRLNCTVLGLSEDSESVSVGTNTDTVETHFLITCSGLMADHLVKMLGIKTDFQIIPFRGEYYQVPPARNKLVNHLIYPIPDPTLPFLGVHLTRMINGSVTVGPNAVLGYKREGYGRFNFDLSDVLNMLSFPGFWRVMFSHIGTAWDEIKSSWYKPYYLKKVQKYCPDIQLDDLKPYPAGVRAQAVTSDGRLVHDFLFAESSRSLHVCNAPSPAATSAIPIGQYICDKLTQ